MVVLDCQEGETKISKEVEPILGVTPWRARLRSSTKLINHTVLRKLFRSYLISELSNQIDNGKLLQRPDSSWMDSHRWGHKLGLYRTDACKCLLNWELKEILP